MDTEKIKALIQMVHSSAVTELELLEGATRIRIARAAAVLPFSAPAMPIEPTATPVAAMPVPAAAAPALSQDVVLSPMGGTFYRRPSPAEAPFVERGGQVEKGQTLALVEAMKTLNAVSAERSGTVIEILAEDGATIDENQRLFVIG